MSRSEISKNCAHGLFLCGGKRHATRPSKRSPMGERVNHMCNDKNDAVEIAMPLTFLRFGCDREAKSAVKTHGEVVSSLRSVRDLAEDDPMELGISCMRINHSIDYGPN